MKYFKYVIVFYVEIYMIIRYLIYVMKITFRQFTFFLRYDNNVMTIWNMLIVVKHR